MSAPLRVGIAGYGRLADLYYAPALGRLAAVEVVAIADPLASSRARATARWRAARTFERLDEMLGAVELDALLVASPPSAHLASWRAASAADLPLFIEKPLLLASQLAELDGGERHERLMVDFNRRFWPPYARARELVTSGALGAPLALEFDLHLDVAAWSTVTTHRMEAFEGGVLHDLGAHALDLASWYLGAPVALRAAASTERRIGARLRLELRFADGSTATADLAYGTRTCERLRGRGPRGRLWLDEPNRALHVEHDGARRARAVVLARDAAALAGRVVRRSRSSGRASIHAALTAFAAAVRGGGSFTPGVEAGLRNVALVAAAERSAAAGGVEIAL